MKIEAMGRKGADNLHKRSRSYVAKAVQESSMWPAPAIAEAAKQIASVPDAERVANGREIDRGSLPSARAISDCIIIVLHPDFRSVHFQNPPLSPDMPRNPGHIEATS